MSICICTSQVVLLWTHPTITTTNAITLTEYFCAGDDTIPFNMIYEVNEIPYTWQQTVHHLPDTESFVLPHHHLFWKIHILCQWYVCCGFMYRGEPCYDAISYGFYIFVIWCRISFRFLLVRLQIVNVVINGLTPPGQDQPSIGSHRMNLSKIICAVVPAVVDFLIWCFFLRILSLRVNQCGLCINKILELSLHWVDIYLSIRLRGVIV